ncbi:hypothetical protein [Flexivirga alba]|uniref:Uncharacterized protein n=1 Tax=Flexivirga alba TaxID=702742 RepID=A0ABW2AHI6_9MICO
MWVDSEGVFHTASLPDPALLIGASMVDFIRNSGLLKRARIQRIVDKEEERFLEDARSAVDIAAYGTDRPYPPHPVFGTVTNVRELRAGLEAVSMTWRLDAIVTIDEMLG